MTGGEGGGGSPETLKHGSDLLGFDGTLVMRRYLFSISRG